MKITALLLLVILSGCIGEHHDSQSNNFPPVTRTELPRAEVLTPEQLDRALGQQRIESQASNNAMQQSMTSAIGASVGKVAEKVDFSLAKIESSVNAKFEAVTTAQAEIKSSIALDAKLNATISAVTDLKATLNTKIEALAAAQAQAGVNNSQSIEKVNETIKAGGNVTQFPAEVKDVMNKMQDTITHGQDANSRDLKIVAGIITALLGASHFRNGSKHNKVLAALQKPKEEESNA